ncbi:universal stress protein [Sulfurivermis fontis]|uniref:universal stress protein n=1 Tax=Sulfurivermis fontis TaxID=1972068 RepID=UPI000FD8D0C6|nr:universal stress protein [Sulfurivermis fontis]
MHRFNNILCVIEAEAEQRWVLERAVTLAQNQQARLTVLTVLDPVPPVAGIVPQSVEQALQQRFIDHVATLLRDIPGAMAPQVKVVFGRGYLAEIREVLRHGYDLVLKPARADADLRSVLFGSDDMHLLRKCPVPVWLLKEGGAVPYRRILAAVDFDPAAAVEAAEFNRRIIELAAALALAESATLHVVHVWEAAAENTLRLWAPGAGEAQVAAYVAEERQRHERWLQELMAASAAVWLGQETLDYLKPQLHLPRGNAGKEVPALAHALGADLIVMGTLGRSGIPGLLIGNTAETILHKVDCAVLALKPAAFVSPVTLP